MKSSSEGLGASYEANARDTCFELAIELVKCFRSPSRALFRNRHIPKPCGLGSGDPRGGLYVPHLSHFCPAFVQPHFALRRAHGSQVSRCSEQRRRETGPLAFGALWRTRGGVAIPGRHVKGIHRSASGEVSVQNVEKCCQPVGAGASKKTEECGPPNFAPRSDTTTDRSPKGGIAFWARTE
jgi:hypothetical protein